MTPNKNSSSNQTKHDRATEATGLLRPGAAGGLETSKNDSTAALATADNSSVGTTLNHQLRKSCLYKLFMIISGSAALTSGLMLVSQIASLVVVKGSFILQLLRLGLAASCVMFLLAELQVRFFLERALLFKSWFYRGILYAFVGGIALEQSMAALGQAYPEMPDNIALTFSLLLQVSSIAMFSFGLLYMFMGMLCLRGVWEDMQIKYNIERDRQPIATMDV